MNPVPATDIVWYILAFAMAAGTVAWLTPLTIRVARTFKIEDTPDGRLKKHVRSTPYLGGLAVATGFVITFALLASNATVDERALGILAGGFMMLLLGLYDDLINLAPGVKFLGQVLAAIALEKAGVSIQIAAVGWWGNFALTVLWITGVTNAFNIIDVMDGLASGVAAIAAAFLFAISLVLGNDPFIPLMALTLAGALIGFLRFNAHPARIFLGDTGSLFIGFMMAALTMVVAYSRHNQLAVFTPLILLAVPIFDTVFVALHRARKGIPFFRGSPDHFALRLAHSGLGVRRTVRAVWWCSVGLGCVAIGVVFGPSALVPWLLGGTAAAALTAFAWLSRLPPPDPGRTENRGARGPALTGDR